MQGCYTETKNGFIQAKTAIYNKKYIEYKDVIMTQAKKKYHKFTYKILLK